MIAIDGDDSCSCERENNRRIETSMLIVFTFFLLLSSLSILLINMEKLLRWRHAYLRLPSYASSILRFPQLDFRNNHIALLFHSCEADYTQRNINDDTMTFLIEIAAAFLCKAFYPISYLQCYTYLICFFGIDDCIVNFMTVLVIKIV